MKQNETKTSGPEEKNTKRKESLDSCLSASTEERGHEIVQKILVKKRHLKPPEEGGKKKRITVPPSTALKNKKKIYKSVPRVLVIKRKFLEKKKRRAPK